MLRFLGKEPSAVLLAAQLAAVLLYPFLEGQGAGQALFAIVGIAVLGLVMLAVRATPALTWVALLLGYGMLYNHSYEANCEYIQDGPRVITFVTLRDVKAGEELTIDYGEEWWSTRNLEPDP